MTQYLDAIGAKYMVDRLSEKLTPIKEADFEELSSLAPECIYAVIPPEPWTTCFNLKAINDGTITITIPSQVSSGYATKMAWTKSPWKVAVEDDTVWNETLVDNTDQTITIPMQAGDQVYIKGAANCWYHNYYNANIQSTCDIIASGNLKYLIYGYETGDSRPESTSNYTPSYALYRLFMGNQHLIDASGLAFDTVANTHTYDGMFSGCTALVAAPELPATTLGEYCYNSMFSGCSSLTTAPELPATNLADYCYYGMFSGCSALKYPPELPATTLHQNCYRAMFQNCAALTTVPELPAETLAASCYRDMFSGCASLKYSPELPATTLATTCYYGMFDGCTALTAAPELPATTLTANCYYNMFRNCSSLTTASEIHATTLASQCCVNMFAHSGLRAAPILRAETLATSCYYQMFFYCSNLQSITMLATDISASNCLYHWVAGIASTGTFTKAASMTTLPTGLSGIPEGWTVVDYSN